MPFSLARYLPLAVMSWLACNAPALAAEHNPWYDIKPVLDSKDVAQVAELLDKEPALLHSVSDYGITPLGFALLHDDLPLIELLIERGALPAQLHPQANPPVVLAVCNRREKYLPNLLAAGANPKARTPNGLNQLNCWVQRAEIAKVNELLDSSWSVNGEEAALPPILSTVFAGDAATSLITALEARGASLQAVSKKTGMGMVDYAVLARRPDLAELFWSRELRFGNANGLIDAIHSQLSPRRPVGYSALQFLVKHRSSLSSAELNKLALLLMASEQWTLLEPLWGELQDLSQVDIRGRNIAHYLIARGENQRLLQLLETAKAQSIGLPDLNIASISNDGMSPFAMAAARAPTGVLKSLLLFGASSAPATETTPLLAALKAGNEEAALWLLTQGADASADVSLSRPSALAVALDRRMLRAARQLLKSGERLSKAPDALESAIDAFDQTWMQLVLKAGFPLSGDVQIGYRQTPLTYLLKEHDEAALNSYDEPDEEELEERQQLLKKRRWLVTLLLAAGADASAENFTGDTPLTIALKQGDKALVSLLLKAKAKLPSKLSGYELERSMRDAINAGNVELIRLFLDGYIRFENGFSSHDWLCQAVQSGQLEVAEQLVQAGAAVATDDRGGTGIACAFSNESMKFMLKHGATVNVRLHSRGGAERLPWLHRALFEKDLTLAKMLLDAGANPNFEANCGRVPLFFAHDAAAVDLLVEHGAKVNAFSSDSSTALVMAVASKVGTQNEYGGRRSCGEQPVANAEKLAALCKHGADINKGFDADTNPAIQRAIKANDVDGLNAILDNCALDLSGKRCQTCATTQLPLPMAVALKRSAMVEKLVAKGAPIDTVQRAWLIPLHIAIRANDKDMTEQLLRLGANPSLLWRSRTALMIAAAEQPTLVPVLLAAGADPSVKNYAGETAHALALASGQSQAAELLMGGRSLTTSEVDTALIAASQSGEMAVVLNMLEQQPSQAAKDKALRKANKLAVIDTLLKANADPNAGSKATGESGQRALTPALVANATNDIAVLERLLAAGADINATDPDGETALLVAAQKSKWATVDYLLSKLADPNIFDENGDSALRYAVQRKQLDLVKRLLAQGADPNARYWYEGAVLMGPLRNLQYKSEEEMAMALLKELLANGADINIRMTAPDGRFKERSPLMAVAASDKFGLVALKYLLANGADIHQRDAGGRTAWLWYASSGRKKDIAEALLAAGADPLAVDNDGNNALHAAGDEGWREGIYEYLMTFGLDINSRNSAGMTPLMSEVYGSSGSQYIERLVKLGADVTAADNNGRTALWWASAFNPNVDFSRRLVPETLVQFGADVNRADNDGVTPLARAITGFRRANEQEPLLELGANPNQLVAKTQLPLVVAAMFKRVEEKSATPTDKDIARRLQWVDGLLKYGADINLKIDGLGTSLTQLKAAKADARLIQAFIDRGAKP